MPFVRIEQRLVEIPSQWHFSLYQSVRDVKFVERRGADFLIEFRVKGFRLGYLVARKTADAFIITTFLFLTMQGTPEARLLADKLRLRRHDVEYQRLDRLSSYVTTDLLNNPLLVKLLEECGCGHLLKVGTPKGQREIGMAGELVHYLRLDDDAHRERVAGRLGIDL